MIPPNIFIEEYTLATAWAKLVKEVMKNGIITPCEYGPRTRDICSMVVVKYPMEEPILHTQFPTKDLHLKEYCAQFSRDYDWKKSGFKYTYLSRLTEPIDQIKYMGEQLQKPTTRRAQAITWIPEIDTVNDEPPCLQYLTMRKLTPDSVELHCHWRSRDIYNAWLTNYIAVISMINREILIPLNLKLIKLVDFIDYAHIYEADFESALEINTVAASPMLMR
jgi:thymidylate synthase